MIISDTQTMVREITKEDTRAKIENAIQKREQLASTNPRADFVWKQEAEKIKFTPDGGYSNPKKDRG